MIVTGTYQPDARAALVQTRPRHLPELDAKQALQHQTPASSTAHESPWL